MTPDDEWPTDADRDEIIAKTVPVRMPLEDNQGAAERMKGFCERGDWLDIQVGHRNWIWMPGGEELAVVYHVPGHIAILFKLTWGGI